MFTMSYMYTIQIRPLRTYERTCFRTGLKQVFKYVKIHGALQRHQLWKTHPRNKTVHPKMIYPQKQKNKTLTNTYISYIYIYIYCDNESYLPIKPTKIE